MKKEGDVPRYKSEEILFVLNTVEWMRDRDVRDALRRRHGVGDGQIAQQLRWPDPNWLRRAIATLKARGLVESRERTDPDVVGYQGYEEYRLTSKGLTIRVESPVRSPRRRLRFRFANLCR